MNRQLHLMPAAAIRRQATAESLVVWLRVMIVAVIGCVAAGVAEAWTCQVARQHRDALEAQHTPIVQLQTDIDLLRTKIASLTDTQQLALELASRRSLLSLLGQIGQSAAYADGDLFVEELFYSKRSAYLDQPASQTLQLMGVARDNLSVTRFADGLRKSGMFSDVQLTSTASRVIAEQSATAFELECMF